MDNELYAIFRVGQQLCMWGHCTPQYCSGTVCPWTKAYWPCCQSYQADALTAGTGTFLSIHLCACIVTAHLRFYIIKKCHTYVNTYIHKKEVQFSAFFFPLSLQNDSDMYREGGELFEVLLMNNPTSVTVDFPTVTHGFVSHHDLIVTYFLAVV